MGIEFIPRKDAHTDGSHVLVITDAMNNGIPIVEMEHPVALMVMWERLMPTQWNNITTQWKKITVSFRCLSEENQNTYSVFIPNKETKTFVKKDHNKALLAFTQQMYSFLPKVTITTEAVASVRPSGADECPLNEKGQPVVTLLPGARVYVVDFKEGKEKEMMGISIKHADGTEEKLQQEPLLYDDVVIRNIRSYIHYVNGDSNTSIEPAEVEKLVPEKSSVNVYRQLAHEAWDHRNDVGYKTVFANLLQNTDFNNEYQKIQKFENKAERNFEGAGEDEENSNGIKRKRDEQQNNATMSRNNNRGKYKTRQKKRQHGNMGK
jgi:hypothetical protein